MYIQFLLTCSRVQLFPEHMSWIALTIKQLSQLSLKKISIGTHHPFNCRKKAGWGHLLKSGKGLATPTPAEPCFIHVALEPNQGLYLWSRSNLFCYLLFCEAEIENQIKLAVAYDSKSSWQTILWNLRHYRFNKRLRLKKASARTNTVFLWIKYDLKMMMNCKNTKSLNWCTINRCSPGI